MSRSFVDPDTNTALISDFDAATYLAWLEGRPLTGRGLLANFLHEWTHRSCNASRVGGALALLKLRSAIRTFNGTDATADYLRCMTGAALLEPLSEGLALFAEFDAYPGDSAFISPTLTAAGLHFAPAIGATDERPLLALEVLLQELRRHPTTVERKGSVYVWPNEYLIGYLAVKSLWAQLAIGCRAFRDRDLYLAYLRSYIYDDPGLGIALLEPEPDEHASGERIGSHLNDRFRTLHESTTLSGDVERWIANALTGTVDVTTIGATAKSDAAFADLFNRASVEDWDRFDQKFTAWMCMTLEERSICALGTAAVAVRPGRSGGSREVVVKPDGPIIGNVGEDVAPTEDASVTLVLNERGRGHTSVLSTGKTVGHLNTMGECSAEDIRLACRHVANRDVSRGLLADFRGSLDDTTVTDYWRVVEPLVREASETIYAPLCTLNSADHEWRAAYTTLKRNGLHAMLGGDAALTRAVAAVCLATSFSDSRAQAYLMCRLAGIEQADFDRAVTVESAGGLRIIKATGQSVLGFV